MRYPGDQQVHVTFHGEKDAFCVGCGYNLRGASGIACPECGVGFQLAMPRPVAHYGLYFTALLCTGALVAGNIYLVFWIALSVKGLVSFTEDIFRLAEHAINLAAIPYLVVLLRMRERITRAEFKARVLIALPPILMIVFIGLRTLYYAVTI